MLLNWLDSRRIAIMRYKLAFVIHRKKIYSTIFLFFLVFSFIWLFLYLLTSTSNAESISSQVSGKILIQVEQHGEAWYVNPDDKKRYYMGRPEDAFNLMRTFGLGITNENLNKIEVAEANFDGVDSDYDGVPDRIEDAFGTDKYSSDTDGDGFSDKEEILSGYNPLMPGIKVIEEDFSSRFLGKIFLQVEAHGEAWYIYPEDGKRYFLASPTDAFEIMRSLGLGITDEDLEKIEIGSTSSLGSDVQDSAYCPMFRCDYRLSGKSLYSGPQKEVEIKWSYGVAERVINLQPSIGRDGTIYWGTWGNVDPELIDDLGNVEVSSDEAKDRARGKFYANDPEDGKNKWVYDPGPLEGHYLGTVETTPAIADDGTLYYGRGDGILYAIYPNGSIKWTYKTLENTNGRGQIISSPIIGPDGTIYFGTQAYLQLLGFGYNIFYAIKDEGSPQLKWRYPQEGKLDSYVTSMASIGDDGTVYFSAGKKFYALNSSDGDLKWKYKGKSTMGSAAIGSDNTLYIHSYNMTKEKSEIYALNPDGSTKWIYYVDFQTTTIPVVANNGVLYFTAGNQRASNSGLSIDESIKEGKLYAINDCGQGCVETKWTFTLSGSAGSRPAFMDSNGTIYVSARGSDELEPNIPAKIWAVKDKGDAYEVLWDFEIPEGEIWGGYPIV